ncbi:MAG: hypothetical protein H0V24_00465 [Chloroflexia bacterium]|nr:hypothetical protein [Chloroflexia bacterium]MDQ3411004.1 hypothetical protein [Chloroflexota bacterium]
MNDRGRIVPYVFAGAMVVAPFLALLYDVTAGLGVLAGALGLTAYVALDATKAAGPPIRQRLLVMAYLNAALAIVAAILFALRLIV